MSDFGTQPAPAGRGDRRYRIEAGHDLDVLSLVSPVCQPIMLLAIGFTYRGKPRILYAKSEQLNMTGTKSTTQGQYE